MNNIKIIKVNMKVPLTFSETKEIRSEISNIQKQMIELNEKTELLLQKLIDNFDMKLVQVIEETDPKKGLITQYYNGNIIWQTTIPSQVNKDKLEDIIELSPKDSLDDRSTPIESSEDMDLSKPENLDSSYEEDEDFFAAPV